MEELNLGMDISEEEVSHLREMVKGGTSDDLTSRCGDTSFDDHTNYSTQTQVSDTKNDVSEIMNYLRSL